jgi:ubiquinone/menaquinone biosynthesis C-methylase UbiE
LDEYTERTKCWLDERFKLFDNDGVYHAHQPIYGFNKGHCEKFEPILSRYVPTYQIMKALSHIEFRSLLDVGGAEGYKAALVRELFGSAVKNSDLSVEACKRAKEIFHLDSDPVDVQCLPYKNSEYDVVICSETLEHVKDIRTAIDELLRVANKAVVITIPHEDRESVEKNIRNQKVHGHIHTLTLDSLNPLKSRGYRVLRKRMLSPYAYIPILSRFVSKKLVVAFLTSFDEFVSMLVPHYSGIIIIILKDKAAYHWTRKSNVSPYRILSFSVPKYYLGPTLKKVNVKS